MHGILLGLLRRTLPPEVRLVLGRWYDRLRASAPAVVGPPSERRRVVRWWFYAAAGRFTPVVAVDLDGRRVLLHTRDESIGRETFSREQPLEADLVLRALEAAGIRDARGRDVLEIGANVGTTTILLSRRLAPRTLVAVEPEPRNHRLLVANVAANELADTVRCLPVAVSDTRGEVEFEISPENAGDHRVRVAHAARAGDLHEEARSTMRVPSVTVDDLIADGIVDADRLALVWLDVQGHEGHALAGAEGLLRRGVPVVTEFWPYGLRRADGLERFLTVAARHYTTCIELREGTGRRSTADLPALAASLGDRADTFTDLLLLP